jgi:hypothetical protein
VQENINSRNFMSDKIMHKTKMNTTRHIIKPDKTKTRRQRKA